jgi:hypothetical protein
MAEFANAPGQSPNRENPSPKWRRRVRKWGVKKKLLFGALGGALGGIAMKSVVALVDRRAFGLSRDTDVRTAHEICRRMGLDPISERRAARLGGGMHHGFSVATGLAYAAAADAIPFLRKGRGTAFGAALWLIGDEVAVSASGLEDPFQASLFSHLSALGAHVLFGMIVAAVHAAGDPPRTLSRRRLENGADLR